MSKTKKAELSIEPYDVSFAEVQSDKDWGQTVQKIATAINVQFTESSQQDLPFVSSKEFRNLFREEKVFLFGPSGCGKSRAIIELVRSKVAAWAAGNDNSCGRIFIINPSNPAGLDTHRENISSLSSRVGHNDLVVWDNFPEGLVKRDLQSAFGALEIISSMPIKNLYIALKPTYLEMYRGLTLDIPDIYTHEITCDLGTMKALLKAYGKDVQEYRGTYEKYVHANVDRIAKILWQKQPLSLTVVDFYKALLASTTPSPSGGAQHAENGKADGDSSKALLMAQAWLPAYDYFERQFEVMKNIQGRQSDVDFLYILRLCYEVGFDRTHDSIASLQKGIFGSSPPAEPIRKLGTWVYLSGQNYAMHDSAKNAIRLPDYSRMKIVSYLMGHFSEIVPRGDGELHSLGLFLGRNVQFVSLPNDGAKTALVPGQVYEFMKKKAVFERAIGRGVGENFEQLEEPLQESILEFVDTEIEFGVGLADSLGERLVDLDSSNREKVLDKIYHGMLFARHFGQSAGRLYGRLSGKLRSVVMSHAERNPQFADGLGMGLGYVYATLGPELQQEITKKAQMSFEISRGLGFGFGLTFGLLQEQDAKKMTELADKNSELDTGFGMGMATGYPGLSPDLRKFVIDRTKRDCLFAFGTGIYAAFVHRESVPSEIFSLLGSNGEVAYGLGVGFGTTFFYLSPEFQSRLQVLLKNDAKLDEGMGTGVGLVIKHLPAEAQAMFISKASASNAFAAGLGYGIGFTWHYIGDELRKMALALAGSNNEFARGMGLGAGSHIDFLKPTFFDQIISLADTNSEFDRGFGSGAALAWPYYSDDARRITGERMATRGEFARGIGMGLARIADHFAPAEKGRLMQERLADPLFSEGFGEGTGHYLWSVYDGADKKLFVEFAADHPEVSRGLGAGIGSMYSYFGGELEKGGPVGQFFEKDPAFRRGVGIGMGRAFTYLTEEGRARGFQEADRDVGFAAGLGEGMGAAYRYLDGSQKKTALSYAGEGDTGFSRGLGSGLGSVFPYLDDDAKNEILALAAHNGQLAAGLGAGIGMRISYLPEEILEKVTGRARSNPRLAEGLGEGCGLEFLRLTKAAKKGLLPLATGVDGFAFGLGVGIGKTRRQIGEDVEKEAAALGNSDEFSNGLAIGFASTPANLSDDALLSRFLSRARADAGFARSLGFGLGHIFSELEGGRKNAILEAMDGNKGFIGGMGEGIGHYLPLTGSRAVEEAMRTVRSPSFQSGLARGIATSFGHLNLLEVLGILEYAGAGPGYGRALGEGLAEMFASFDEDRQSMILDAIQKESEFSRRFAKGVEKSMPYVSAQTRKRIEGLKEKLPHLQGPFLEDDRSEHPAGERSRFDHFPVAGLSKGQMGWNVGNAEIAFSGKVQECCVCFIDMVGSTRISSNLTSAQLSRYYEIFLNMIARIAGNFGARIVKNAGDALIFYFEDARQQDDQVKSARNFKNVLDCCLTMGMASGALNAKMLSEKLPPVQYRISADYGEVSVAKSSSSQSEDLFGSTMNICAKINSKAKLNGLVVGQALFEQVRGLDAYTFVPASESLVGLKGEYKVYHVDEKEKTSVINPFERRAIE